MYRAINLIEAENDSVDSRERDGNAHFGGCKYRQHVASCRIVSDLWSSGFSLVAIVDATASICAICLLIGAETKIVEYHLALHTDAKQKR